MPKFHKKEGRWVIRFKKSSRTPVEKAESLPGSTPVGKVRHIEGKMNAAYHDDWDPWVEDWTDYQRRQQMRSDGVIDSGLTLSEAIDVYIDKLSVRGRLNSPYSESNYRTTLDMLAGSLKSPFMLADLTPRQAELFLRSLDVKDSTFAEYAKRIALFFGYWHGKGMIRETFEFNRPRMPREDKIKYITEAQKDKIIEHYRSNRRAILERIRSRPPEWMDFDDMIEVLFYQGFRRSEVFDSRIHRRDVDIAAGKVTVLGKGNKHRTVDITPPVRGHFRRAWMATDSPDDNLMRTTDTVMRRLLKKLAKKALGPDYEWISLHNLRHSAGTYWAGLGVPIATVQKLLGHSSVNTTMIYAKITDQSSRDHFDAAWNKDTPITKIGND